MFSAGVGSRSWLFKTAGVGSRSRFFKTAGVGVGFSKLLESEDLLQLSTPINYNINCLKIITGQY